MIMVNVNTLELNDPSVAPYLEQVSPKPSQLFYLGQSPQSWIALPKVAVVGSRKATAYGQGVTQMLVESMAKRGVVIISGLALGIDSIAHRAALDSGATTVAVLPTPVESIYPPSHLSLAHRIIEKDGCILSEYPNGAPVYRHNFIARNRIVSGLADALLITEAAAGSGTMHTARFALEQGKTVMVVPGSITSPSSQGCNNLIKSGAVPVTEADDIFFALGIKESADEEYLDLSKFDKNERTILRLIGAGIGDQEEMAISTKMESSHVVSVLTGLELSGAIRPEGAGRWTLS